MPTRIEPLLDDQGQPLDRTPGIGGRWLRDPDGGYTPADESTAIGAGLEWPAQQSEE